MVVQICRVLLTGAPYGGKSSSSEWITQQYRKRGFRVLCIAETATEVLRMQGNPPQPFTQDFIDIFQRGVAISQIVKERVAEASASVEVVTKAPPRPPGKQEEDTCTLIIFDRCVMDGKLFYNQEFSTILDELACQINTETFRENNLPPYDIVAHLESLACVGMYKQHSGNTQTTRIHNTQEAWELDRRFTEVFSSHKNYKFIPACNDEEVRRSMLLSIIDEHIYKQT